MEKGAANLMPRPLYPGRVRASRTGVPLLKVSYGRRCPGGAERRVYCAGAPGAALPLTAESPLTKTV
jgi:hypothetical protein